MPLVNPIEILYDAKKNKRAIAAFNVHNLESLQAVCEAAKDENYPVILQTTPGSVKHIGLPFIVSCARTAAEVYNITLALHVDHCSDLGMIHDCINGGYTSVMIDCSVLPYDENIATVWEIVKAAHAKGIMVEAELGKISGVEDERFIAQDDSEFTDPEQAVDFAEKSGLDTLAVAIGTAHGTYKGKPELDFARLAEISRRVSVPLVLHGASGVYDEDVRRAIDLGICKVNIATELKIPMKDAIQRVFAENPEENDPRKYLGAVKIAVKEVAARKIRICKNM